MASSSFSQIAKQYAGMNPRLAPRHDMLALLADLVSLNETSLTTRPTHASRLVARVNRRVGGAPSFSEAIDKKSTGGPLIRVEETHSIKLSLWGALLPWEVQRGYSNTPAAVVCGANGRPLSRTTSDEDESDAAVTKNADRDLLKDDPLAVVSAPNNNSSSIAAAHRRRDLQRLDGSNGVLFVHRGVETPHYWSGGIQAGLDVSFLALPTESEAAQSTSLASVVAGARTGLTNKDFQLLGRTVYGTAGTAAGYGVLDDPTPYHYYLSNNKTMRLTVESTSALDPFPSVLDAMPTELGGKGLVFCGDHTLTTADTSMRHRHQCAPQRTRGPITAILETRQGLSRDFLSAIETPNKAARSDYVEMDLVLESEFMQHLDEKEMFYRAMVEGLEIRVGEMLEDMLRVQFNEHEERHDESRDNGATNSRTRPMESWKEARNKNAPRDELMSEVPPTPAASHKGADGSFSLSKMRSAVRFAKCQPNMPTAPAFDTELFAFATRLGLAHYSQQRVLPRLIDDLTRQRIDDEGVDVLYGLATDPSVQVYPSQLLMAIHKAKGRMDLKHSK